MTLANTDPSAVAVLLEASSPAARGAEFTSHGRVIAQITIPTSAGSALPVGPPNPDRLVLTGLRHPLRPGQFVTLDLTFARAGHATLRVPVTRAPSFSWAPLGCLRLGLGGSRGDGLARSPVKGRYDTAASGSREAVDRPQGDAPQSAG